MKLLTWNIRHGGGSRLARIVEGVTAHDPDVMALTEYRDAPGKELRAALVQRGWAHAETTEPTGRINGIAVFSRTPLIHTRPCPAVPEHQVRWLDVYVPEYGFGISVLHIMAAGSNRVAKTRFWDAVLDTAEARLHEPSLFLGDWNTGAHRADQAGRTFVCSEHFQKLSEIGWIDLWRHRNPGTTEWTWYSTLKGGVRGNGFRLDHAFGTPLMLPRVFSCRYSHREREAGISDHSMMILEVE